MSARAVLALAAASLLWAAPAAEAGGRSPRTFHHDRFTLELPAGWWLADWRPGPPARRFAPARKPRAAASAPVVHFADGRGNYFTVRVDRATDVEADAVWILRTASDGVSVEIGAEDPCVPGRGPCSVGNGSLEIGTLPPVQLSGHRFSFVFGNVLREQGVGLDPFRWMLQGFRAR